MASFLCFGRDVRTSDLLRVQRTPVQSLWAPQHPQRFARVACANVGMALVVAVRRLQGINRRQRCRRAAGKPRAAELRGDAWLEATNFPRQLWDLTSEELQLLRDEGRVQKQARVGKKGWGLVRINVRAPEEVVFACLRDFQRYPSMISAIRAADVAPSADDACRCSYRITKLWLEVPTVHQVEPRNGRISFDIDPSATGLVLREASGFWQVRSDHRNPTASRVVFRVFAHASDLMPNWLVEYGARKCLKRATAWLKPYAEQLWVLFALPSYRQHPPAIDPGDTPLQPLPPGASSATPRVARLLLDQHGRPGVQTIWIPSAGLQLQSIAEAPGQPDLCVGHVISVIGSSSLAEAKTEEEAMKSLADECDAANAQLKRGISCVISTAVAKPIAVAPATLAPTTVKCHKFLEHHLAADIGTFNLYVGAMESEEGSYPLPAEDDKPVALPPSKGIRPGNLWGDANTTEAFSTIVPESEEAADGDIEGQLKYQHQKVMKKLEAHEQMLKKVLISIRSLAFQGQVGGSMVSPVSSGRHSLSSSGDAGVGKVASLRSYGGSRNPRSLDTDMKVNCDTNTGWEKFKPAPDPISEGNDGSGNISHASNLAKGFPRLCWNKTSS
eukprot:symbB.v1.2.022412.t1/scaffold1988.1/size93529/6